MSGRRLRVFAGVFALVSSLATGEALPLPRPRFQIDKWKTPQGLPQNWVESIAQTKNGYLWASTRAGLARFDGIHMTTISEIAFKGFKADFAKRLLADENGNLWVGTRKGLLLINTQGATAYRVTDALCDNEVSSLAEGKHGIIWIGSARGITRFEGKEVAKFPTENFALPFVYSVCERASGDLLVGFLGALRTLNPRNGRFSDLWVMPEHLPESEDYLVRSILERSNGELWYGTKAGLFRYENETWRRFSVGDGLADTDIQQVYETSENELLVLSRSDLHLFDGATFHPVGLRDQLNGTVLRSVAQDMEGNLWVGTGFEGLVRLKRVQFQTVTTEDGLCNDEVWSICPRAQGGVWIATGAGLSCWDGERIRSPTLESDISSPLELARINFRSVLEDHLGNLWLGGSTRGLLFFEKHGDDYVERRHLTPANQICSLAQSAGGAIWIGSREGVECGPMKPGWKWNFVEGVWNPRTFSEAWIYRDRESIVYPALGGYGYRGGFWWEGLSSLLPEDYFQAIRPDVCGTNWITGKLSSYDVRAILETRDGTIWLGTAGGGLNYITNGEFAQFSVPVDTTLNTIWTLHEDSEGALWAGGRNGLARIKSGNFHSFSQSDGLPENVVNQILEDDARNLWIGCNKGIYRAALSDLEAVAEGRSSRAKCILFDESDGFLSAETAGGAQPAGCKTKDGKLWFATPRGAVIIDPKSVKVQDIPPPVLLQQVKANDETVFVGSILDGQPTALPRRGWGAGDLLQLKPGSGRVLELSYTANSFSCPEKIRFKCRLEPHDAGWRDLGDRRVTYYTNLKPGRYRFQVTSCNHYGTWNPTGAELTFQILPFFWETARFKVAAASVLALTVLGFVQWRVSLTRKVQQLQAQAEVARERERIARDMHDEIGARLSHLALLSEANESGTFRAKNLPPVHLPSAIRETARSLDEIVWAVQPEKDSLAHLASYVAEYAHQFLAPTHIQLQIDYPDFIPDHPLSAQERHELFMVIKEALNNAVKHSKATRIRICLATGSALGVRLTIADNGVGLHNVNETGARGGPNPIHNPVPGKDGLSNLCQRMESIGGSCSVCSDQNGCGTCVELTIPPFISK